MKFNHRENEKVTLHDGRKVFLSRSLAVAVQVWCLHEDEWYVLLTRRGPSMNASGKWCCPCGYLDWDESLEDAARREVFEETGLVIPVHMSLESLQIISDPFRDPLQNVTAHFRVRFAGPESVNFPATTEPDGLEVSAIRWEKWDPDASVDRVGLFAFSHADYLNASFSQLEKVALSNR